MNNCVLVLFYFSPCGDYCKIGNFIPHVKYCDFCDQNHKVYKLDVVLSLGHICPVVRINFRPICLKNVSKK